MIMFFVALLTGLIIGYWLYPLHMAYKLMKIQKQLVALEIDYMKIKEELDGTQWNEDKL